MPLRCIFVPTGPGIQPERRLDAALRLARHTHAHIDTLFVSPDDGARPPSPNPASATSLLPHCTAAFEMKPWQPWRVRPSNGGLRAQMFHSSQCIGSTPPSHPGASRAGKLRPSWHLLGA